MKLIVSAHDPEGVVPFEVGGLPGVFPCPLEDWLASTGLTKKHLEAHKTVLAIKDASPAGDAHTATTEPAADISAAVTRKKAS